MKKSILCLALLFGGYSVHAQQTISSTEKKKLGLALFLETIERGNPQQAELLLQNGVGPNDVDPTFNGMTLLMAACSEGKESIVRLLLSYNAQLNTQDDEGKTALLCTCLNNHSRIVKLLLENGADPLLSMNNGMAPLHATCLKGSRDSLALLLAQDIDVTITMDRGFTPLYAVGETNNTDKAQLLLDYAKEKFSQEEFEDFLNAQNDLGETALHKACVDNNLEVATILLSAGSNPNKRTRLAERTSLHAAVLNNNHDIAQALLNHPEIEVNALDKAKHSPLTLATSQKHTKMMKLLRKYGADPHSRIGLSVNELQEQRALAKELKQMSPETKFSSDPSILNNPELHVTYNDTATYVEKHGTKKMIKAIASCASCGQGGDLKTCGGCREEYYCSSVCQRKHWPVHKIPCKQKQALQNEIV